MNGPAALFSRCNADGKSPARKKPLPECRDNPDFPALERRFSSPAPPADPRCPQKRRRGIRGTPRQSSTRCELSLAFRLKPQQGVAGTAIAGDISRLQMKQAIKAPGLDILRSAAHHLGKIGAGLLPVSQLGMHAAAPGVIQPIVRLFLNETIQVPQRCGPVAAHNALLGGLAMPGRYFVGGELEEVAPRMFKGSPNLFQFCQLERDDAAIFVNSAAGKQSERGELGFQLRRLSWASPKTRPFRKGRL